jgi:hypothetical protein
MLFIETAIFTKQASGGLFTDEELEDLQKELFREFQGIRGGHSGNL